MYYLGEFNGSLYSYDPATNIFEVEDRVLSRYKTTISLNEAKNAHIAANRSAWRVAYLVAKDWGLIHEEPVLRTKGEWAVGG